MQAGFLCKTGVEEGNSLSSTEEASTCVQVSGLRYRVVSAPWTDLTYTELTCFAPTFPPALIRRSNFTLCLLS